MAGDPKKLERLVRGLVQDGDESVQIGWILSDGKILSLDFDPDSEDDHVGHVGSVLRAEKESGYSVDLSGDDAAENVDKIMHLFMRETGAIRVTSYNYTMLHLLVLPTPAQIDAACRIARYTQQEESGAGLEIFWEPDDRLVQIKPLTAGRVRKTLEALPGLPRGE